MKHRSTRKVRSRGGGIFGKSRVHPEPSSNTVSNRRRTIINRVSNLGRRCVNGVCSVARTIRNRFRRPPTIQNHLSGIPEFPANWNRMSNAQKNAWFKNVNARVTALEPVAAEYQASAQRNFNAGERRIAEQNARVTAAGNIMISGINRATGNPSQNQTQAYLNRIVSSAPVNSHIALQARLNNLRKKK